MIQLGNGELIWIGKENISIKAFDETNWNRKYLSDVFYEPTIKMNLYSPYVAMKKGYQFKKVL